MPHYKDVMFDRWEESKSSQPLRIVREFNIDDWNVLITAVLITKSVSLIFKEPIKFPMHRIKHEFPCIDTKPRAKRASRCQDIHRNNCAPPAAEVQRRPRFKIGRLSLSGGAISALAVNQGCLCGPETRILARKESGLAGISASQGVAPHET